MTTLQTNLLRALIDAGFIMFLFYSNLLMGEFERSGMGQVKGLAWANRRRFHRVQLPIGSIAALSGYALAEFLRNRL